MTCAVSRSCPLEERSCVPQSICPPFGLDCVAKGELDPESAPPVVQSRDKMASWVNWEESCLQLELPSGLPLRVQVHCALSPVEPVCDTSELVPVIQHPSIN